MNEIQRQYKRETGQQPTVGYEAYYDPTWNRTEVHADLRDFLEDDVVELFQLDYVRWLEEKADELQKIKS